MRIRIISTIILILASIALSRSANASNEEKISVFFCSWNSKGEISAQLTPCKLNQRMYFYSQWRAQYPGTNYGSNRKLCYAHQGRQLFVKLDCNDVPARFGTATELVNLVSERPTTFSISKNNLNSNNQIQIVKKDNNGSRSNKNSKITPYNNKKNPDLIALEHLRKKGSISEEEYKLALNKISEQSPNKDNNKPANEQVKKIQNNDVINKKEDLNKITKLPSKIISNNSNSTNTNNKTINRIVYKVDKQDQKKNLIENINQTQLTRWERDILEAEAEEANYKCELYSKRDLKDVFKKNIKLEKFLTKNLNYCIKKSQVLKLGTYKKIEFSKSFLKEANCKNEYCMREKAGKKVYELFAQKGERYHAKYPGKMIEGMAWFEILYLHKLKTDQKSIERYLSNDYDATLSKIYKNQDEWKLFSLIKLNEGRIKMRNALGFTLFDSTSEVIQNEFLLANFLNKDELEISENFISDEMKKRKELIDKYKVVLTKYKNKLEEEKMKRGIN